MQIDTQVTDLNEVEIKFEKLCKIAKDIEENGENGDYVAQDIVIKSIINSENEELFKKLEYALLDKEQPEVLKTVITGILMVKQRYSSLSEYVESILGENYVIGDELKDRECLLIIADSLVKAVCDAEKDEQEKFLNSLFKLYNASCHHESSALLADRLLQRFVNILPGKHQAINQKLSETINSLNAEINSRLVSVDILLRSAPMDCFSIIENIISGPDKYSNNSIEKLYLYDVTTKVFNALVKAGMKTDYSLVMNSLKNTDFSEIIDKNVINISESENEQYKVIVARINKRVSELNEILN